jgi:hypothetical protein
VGDAASRAILRGPDAAVHPQDMAVERVGQATPCPWRALGDEALAQTDDLWGQRRRDGSEPPLPGAPGLKTYSHRQQPAPGVAGRRWLCQHAPQHVPGVPMPLSVSACSNRRPRAKTVDLKWTDHGTSSSLNFPVRWR